MNGWSRRFLADSIVLYPPGGREQGAVRITERIRPLRPVQQILREVISRFEDPWQVEHIGEVRPLVTLEGEHAALVKIDMRAQAVQAVVMLGIVFGDDFYATVEAMSFSAEQHGQFQHYTEHLTRHFHLGLGMLRRRRYLYTPPPGWQALARTHSVTWYPPDYPRLRALIRVFDAKPADTSQPMLQDRRLVEDLALGMGMRSDAPPAPVSSDYGLNGLLTVTTGQYEGGPTTIYAQVALVDTRFSYLLRLESSVADIVTSREIFAQLIKTVFPVPLATTESEGALVQWAD